MARTDRVDVDCPLCDGGCADADLVPLLAPELAWLWVQIALAADRRADTEMSDGALSVTTPDAAADRAAAVGLLGGRPLAAGQARRIDLAALTTRIRVRGGQLTPGVVAAHATGRRLAARAHARAQRRSRAAELEQFTGDLLTALPDGAIVRPDPAVAWPELNRAGWVARILASTDPQLLLRQAVGVIGGLPEPGRRLDRRLLAERVTGNPHALDDTPLAGLALALLSAVGAAPAGERSRHAWASVGVDFDDLTGGLISVGVHPAGWVIPAGVSVTVPPRELVRCDWPAPGTPGEWVFVTENPSVATAAAELAADLPVESGPVRLLCTVGTPSAREVEAVARLADAGWRVAVRADFDAAGLAHVAALLDGVPGAVGWRMGAGDYLMSLELTPPAANVAVNPDQLPATPWDEALRVEMTRQGLAAFEETLIDQLLADLAGPHRGSGSDSTR